MHLNGENRLLKCDLKGKTYRKMDRIVIHVFIKNGEKKIMPRALSAPAPGLYTYIYDHNIHRSSLKRLGQSKPNFMWSIVRKGE